MDRTGVMNCRADTACLQFCYPLIPVARNSNGILVINVAISRMRDRGLYDTIEMFRQERCIGDALFCKPFQLLKLNDTKSSLKLRHPQVVPQCNMPVPFALSMAT